MEEALRALSSGRRSLRADARARLLSMAEDGGVWREALDGRLEELAASKDAFARGTAWLALAVLRGERALPILEAHLGESEADARLDLLHAFAWTGPAGLPFAARFLRDEVFEIRFAAAAWLLEDEPPVDPALRDACFEVLREGVGFDDTRYEALTGLHRLGDARALEPAREVFGRFFVSGFERVAAAGILAQQGEASGLTFLLEKAGQRRGLERGLAIELLGELGAREAAEVLKRAALSPKDAFRGAAARNLGVLGCEGAFETLSGILSAPDDGAAASDDVKADAAEGLAALGTPEAERALRQALEVLPAEGHDELRAELEKAARALAAAHEGAPDEKRS